MICCGMCLEVFKAEDTVSGAPCGHIYHNVCWSQWLPRRSSCPSCQAFVIETRLNRIYFNVLECQDTEILMGRLDFLSMEIGAAEDCSGALIACADSVLSDVARATADATELKNMLIAARKDLSHKVRSLNAILKDAGRRQLSLPRDHEDSVEEMGAAAVPSRVLAVDGLPSPAVGTVPDIGTAEGATGLAAGQTARASPPSLPSRSGPAAVRTVGRAAGASTTPVRARAPVKATAAARIAVAGRAPAWATTSSHRPTTAGRSETRASAPSRSSPRIAGTRAPPARPTEATRAAPARPTEATRAAPARPTESARAAPARTTESARAPPARPTESARAPPARPTESARAHPARPTESARAHPARPTESARAAPARPTEAAGAAPARPTEAAGAAPARPTEAAGAAPARPTEAAGATPARPAEAARAAPARLARNMLQTPIHARRPFVS